MHYNSYICILKGLPSWQPNTLLLRAQYMTEVSSIRESDSLFKIHSTILSLFMRSLFWVSDSNLMYHHSKKSTHLILLNSLREIVWTSLGLFFSGSVFVCSGCHNKIPQAGWLNQLKFIFSQFWGLEVQEQVLTALVIVRPLSLACRQLPSCCLSLWLSPCACVPPVPLLLIRTAITLE